MLSAGRRINLKEAVVGQEHPCTFGFLMVFYPTHSDGPGGWCSATTL